MLTGKELQILTQKNKSWIAALLTSALLEDSWLEIDAVLSACNNAAGSTNAPAGDRHRNIATHIATHITTHITTQYWLQQPMRPLVIDTDTGKE